MYGRDLLKLINSGIQPIIEFTEEAEFVEYDVDKDMQCKIVSCSEPDRHGTILLKCDLNGFEEYNKTFAKCNWFDENRNPRLTWFESGYYPKDGIYKFYIDADYEITTFKIVEENKLYNEYKQSETDKTYVRWLESLVEELRE